MATATTGCEKIDGIRVLRYAGLSRVRSRAVAGWALKPGGVGQVLRTSDGLLVPDQMRAADDWNPEVLERDRRAVRPRVIELHAVNGCHQIDATGGHADLKDDAGGSE